MRNMAFLLAAAILAGGLCGALRVPGRGPPLALGQALAADEDARPGRMPPELYGFVGTLTGRVLRPSQDWFIIKVVQVTALSLGNKTKLDAVALTNVWKDENVAVKGVPGMAVLEAGDVLTITAAQFEEHLRATKVVKQDGQASNPKEGLPAGGAQPPATKPARGRLPMKTYTYKQVGDLKIEADVYRPEGSQPRPVLIWLHGGALVMGSKKGVPQDLLELCRTEGYCLISANYRLAPQVKLPQIIEDLRDFIKWVSEKGPALFHADPSKVVVAGGSAGGYLTMMAGLCEPRPKGLVAYYGYGDVDGPWYTTPSEHYRKQPLVAREDAYKGMTADVATEPFPGGLNRGRLYLYYRQNGLWTKKVTGFDPATEKAKLDPYCPVRNITAEYPPIVMLHGTADTDVPCQESLDMDAALTKAGVRHEMFAVPGAGHGLGGGDRRMTEKATTRAREFIKEILGARP